MQIYLLLTQEMRGRRGNQLPWSWRPWNKRGGVGADPGAISAISPVTRWTYENPTALEAGDVGEEGETAAAELEDVK